MVEDTEVPDFPEEQTNTSTPFREDKMELWLPAALCGFLEWMVCSRIRKLEGPYSLVGDFYENV